MEKWLVLSNCQTFGLANSLTIQYPSATIDSLDVWAYKSDIAGHDAKLHNYQKIIVHPEFLDISESKLNQVIDPIIVPSMFFSAYHPDSCYAASSSGGIDSPIGAYNSMICLSAYRNGLTVDQALQHYNARTYERAGFFDVWSRDKQHILNLFNNYGLDLSEGFLRWGRYKPFMYSVNHPNIDVVFDIAAATLKRMGVNSLEARLLPHDNLTNGPCFAIYNEVAEHCGIKGFEFFKEQGHYRLLSLEDFVRGSYRLLEGHDPKSVVVDGMADDRFQKLLQIMEP
ncbi:hypothetical protein EPK99_09220 [Neorhizobium lilium]|uniref:Polysaccharide biosynthesis enzyme WcbI domain-containing protein n=1 Tax=Neorhizobium lilium TaxID=2503024 RepID=A0A3S3RIB1_9HYPH|nr:WcbI family polysaccharide biosynthesis putative acetyltransferase [Neorhizobium lilium]RWX78759.1 hypothetical protein EPK99_09220 [Neorhizobium lilium]